MAVTRYAVLSENGELVASGFKTSADADAHRDRVRKKTADKTTAAQYTTVAYTARA